MDHLRCIVEATTKAEELVLRGAAPAGLTQVLNDIGWTSEPMAREMMVPGLFVDCLKWHLQQYPKLNHFFCTEIPSCKSTPFKHLKHFHLEIRVK